MSSHWLVDGPRGRRLVWQIVLGCVDGVTWDPSLDDVRDALERVPSLADASADEVLWAFADSVAWARYWQEPDGTDQVLAGATELLAPLAATVPVPSWWAAPVRLEDQVLTQWQAGPLELTGVKERLQGWRQGMVAEEVEAQRRDPSLAWSGAWWSTPVGREASAPATARVPEGLLLVEDDGGGSRPG